jgi:UDP-N-acetylmuramoylalanine--D-glutamate ligase
LGKKGRALVLIGEAADRIEHAVGGALPVARANSMDDAVERAFLWRSRATRCSCRRLARVDMFKSYADRGEFWLPP